MIFMSAEQRRLDTCCCCCCCFDVHQFFGKRPRSVVSENCLKCWVLTGVDGSLYG